MNAERAPHYNIFDSYAHIIHASLSVCFSVRVCESYIVRYRTTLSTTDLYCAPWCTRGIYVHDMMRRRGHPRYFCSKLIYSFTPTPKFHSEHTQVVHITLRKKEEPKWLLLGSCLPVRNSAPLGELNMIIKEKNGSTSQRGTNFQNGSSKELFWLHFFSQCRAWMHSIVFW